MSKKAFTAPSQNAPLGKVTVKGQAGVRSGGCSQVRAVVRQYRNVYEFVRKTHSGQVQQGAAGNQSLAALEEDRSALKDRGKLSQSRPIDCGLYDSVRLVG